MTVHGRDHLALMDALGIEKCHLYGHSTGGIIISHMLTMAPKRFGKVLMLDPVSPLGLQMNAGQVGVIMAMKTDPDVCFAGLASAAPTQLTMGVGDADAMRPQRRHARPPRLVAAEGFGALVGPLLGLVALHRRSGRSVLVGLALSVAACGPAPLPPAPVAGPGEWREFEGSWNAAGSRRTIPLGADRRGSIIDLRGTMLLAGPGRPGAGFRAEVIALVDSETGLQGRGVWTDERGEQVFTALKGEGTAARNRISGEILGGTGRFAGATGSYEFSWQFVLEAEDGAIQGRAVGLKGRVLLGPPTPRAARP